MQEAPIWVEIHGVQGVYEAENMRVREREEGMAVCCGSALRSLEAWRKWPVHSSADHRNEGHGCTLEDFISYDFPQIGREGGQRVNGIHAWKQLNHRIEARKCYSSYCSFLVIIVRIRTLNIFGVLDMYLCNSYTDSLK